MNDIDHWRNQLGTTGVWCTTDMLAIDDAVALARRIEALGFGCLWLPETMGKDPFAHIGHLAAVTDSLTFATGIANIHHRHPGAMAQAATTLAEQSGGRFVNALGVSHAPLVEGLRGLDYSKPLAAMRTYLTSMAGAPFMGAGPERPAPVLIGALGPKMIALSGELADGAHPYWTTPEHTAQAREILGPDKLLCVEQKVVATTDRAVMRRTAEAVLGVYISLPNYRNNWKRLGFSDAEIDAKDDRFLDAVIGWGEMDDLQARVDEHLAAGADHVCIQPMTPEHPFTVDTSVLEALAPSA